jgi:hypothetical protein
MVSDRDVRSAAVQPGAIAGRIMTPDPRVIETATQERIAPDLSGDP